MRIIFKSLNSKNYLYLFVLLFTGAFCFADSIKVEGTSTIIKTEEGQSKPPSSVNTKGAYDNSKELTKKEKRERRKMERKERNNISKSAHESMLVGGTKHQHGFTGKKVYKGNAPLKSQTFCPVMGGPIDKKLYADYKGMRVYFCCEGCIYQFKRTPSMYIKTSKRYGEKPEKVK